MLSINKKSIIYVICPANIITGGPEAINQLVYKLNIKGINCKIAYYPKCDNPRPEIYNKYYPGVNYIFEEDIIDDINNYLIVPETLISKLDNYKSINKCIWWLSVDNMERKIGLFIKIIFLFNPIILILKAIKNKHDFLERIYIYYNYLVLKYLGKINISKDIIHFYQSKYAENYILNHFKGKKVVLPLSDYINQEFINTSIYNIEKKENIVVYNPKKGFRYTKKLIDKYGNKIKFLPICNMTPNEVQILLQKSKIYIDFGIHPGKDRIPREAVLQGCCILTNNKGSANFFYDIPTLSKYTYGKFDAKKINDNILEIFENYKENNKNFDLYRIIVKNGEKKFEEEIDNLIIKV